MNLPDKFTFSTNFRKEHLAERRYDSYIVSWKYKSGEIDSLLYPLYKVEESISDGIWFNLEEFK